MPVRRYSLSKGKMQNTRTHRIVEIARTSHLRACRHIPEQRLTEVRRTLLGERCADRPQSHRPISPPWRPQHRFLHTSRRGDLSQGPGARAQTNEARPGRRTGAPADRLSGRLNLLELGSLRHERVHHLQRAATRVGVPAVLLNLGGGLWRESGGQGSGALLQCCTRYAEGLSPVPSCLHPWRRRRRRHRS